MLLGVPLGALLLGATLLGHYPALLPVSDVFCASFAVSCALMSSSPPPGWLLSLNHRSSVIHR